VSKHRAVHVRARRGGALVLGGAAALGLLVPAAGTSFAAGVTCGSFTTQPQAQAAFDANPAGLKNLDRDHDGKACDTLPGGSSASAPKPSTPKPAPPKPAPSKPSAGSSSSEPVSASSPSHSSSHTSAPSRHAASADRDCDDFASQQDAQDALDAAPGDPERLDADDDGIACEGLDHGDTVTTGATNDDADDVAAAPVADRSASDVPVGAVDAGDGSAPSDAGDVFWVGLLSSAAVAGAVGARQLVGGRHRRIG
jgi:hypothetical protein